MRNYKFYRSIAVVLVIQLVFGGGSLSWGQGSRGGEKGEKSATRGKSAPGISRASKGGAAEARGRGGGGGEGVSPSQESLPGGQALSRAVVPNQYTLGPGDGLSINLWGEYDESYEVRVSPDGKISLPTIGDLTLKGLTLTQAEALLEAEVKKYYRNIRSGLSLTSLRVFEILVLGAVQNPGTYMATPVRRVSDAIEKAGGILNDGSRRHIQIKQDARVRATADLHAFLQQGDEAANPFLQDGDMVFVPPMGEQRVTVHINEVATAQTTGALTDNLVPHMVEIKSGERLATVISEVGGVSPWWELEGVFVQREAMVPEGTMRIPVDLRRYLIEKDEGQNIVMLAGDQVYIPATIRRVFLAGSVKTPGGYTYFPGRHVDAYVAQAGGMSLAADLDKSFIKRADGTVMPYVGAAELNDGDTVVIMEKVFKTYQDYFAFIGSVAGVILSAVGMVAIFNLKR